MEASGRSSPVRILIVSSHPVQYAIPTYLEYTRNPDVELTVAHCTTESASARFDKEFGVEVSWGIPMLSGYRFIAMRNRARHPTPDSFFGMVNTEVWGEIRDGGYDLVIAPGYRGATFWIAFAAARRYGVLFAWATEVDRFASPHTPARLARVKRIVLPRIYGLADLILSASTRSVRFLNALRLRPLVRLTPYTVDVDYFADGAAAVDRGAVRREWGVPDDAFVVATCSKLIPKKRTGDVIEALARVPGAYLVIAGDGELRSDLEAAASALGVDDRVRFIGFADQPQMIEVYAASDVLALASDFEPFGLVVAEAMSAGRPTVVSDQVSCCEDLVEPGRTGWIYPVGDVAALAERLTEAMVPGVAAEAGVRARDRMGTWTPADHVTAVVAAAREGLARRRV